MWPLADVSCQHRAVHDPCPARAICFGVRMGEEVAQRPICDVLAALFCLDEGVVALLCRRPFGDIRLQTSLARWGERIGVDKLAKALEQLITFCRQHRRLIVHYPLQPAFPSASHRCTLSYS